MPPLILLLNQKLWEHQIWHAGWRVPKCFRKINFELMTS